VAVLAGGIAVLATGNDASGASEVFLEPADAVGRDPFVDLLVVPVPSIKPALNLFAGRTGGIASVAGDAVGLYGGTRNDATCDREQLIGFLTSHPDQGRAWASVQGIGPADIPAYVRALTPLQLRVDTRVTNHGFADGVATPLQSVLQAGTAVLVDANGVPRARCACGNPLLPPQALQGSISFRGDRWNGFAPENVRRIVSGGPVTEFVVHDARTDRLFVRPAGTAGQADHDPAPGTTVVTAPPGPATTSPVPGPPASTTAVAEVLAPSTSDGGSTTTTRGGPAPGQPTSTTTAAAPGTSVAGGPGVIVTTTAATSPASTPSTTAPTTTATDPTTTASTVATVPVPEVRQQDQATALAVLKRRGLVGQVRTTELAGAKPGTVVEQDPPPDTVVEEGSVVVLTVAKAPSAVVPQVIELSADAAQKAVEAAGLTFKGVQVSQTPNLACGATLVRDSSPQAGAVVPVGSTVTVDYVGGFCRLR
jgi:hypothetical protein